jgi:hypothetical protein
MAAKQGPHVLFCMPNRTKFYPFGFSDASLERCMEEA